MKCRWLWFLTGIGLMACNRGPSPEAVKELFLSVQRGETHTLQQALEDGVDPNIFHYERGYLIGVATDADNTAALKILIAAGADLNAYNERASPEPIFIALIALKCEHAKLLLERGADPDVRFRNAGNLAIGGMTNLTAREVYRVQSRQFAKLMEKQGACWREVERLLG